MKLLHSILVECEECKELFSVNTDLDCVSVCERSMGAESAYEGHIESDCPRCGNQVNVNLFVWEYPVGSVNYQEEDVDGATIIEGPDYDPFEYDDIW